MIGRGILFFATVALTLSLGVGAHAATIFDTTVSPTSGFFQFGITGSVEKKSQQFTTIGPVTSGSVQFDGTFNESGAGADSSFTMEIWSDDGGGLPDFFLFSANETFDTTDIAGLGPTDLTFNFTSVTLTDATSYHLVVDDPLPDADDDDFRIKRTSATDEYLGHATKTFDGTSWVASSPTIDYFGVLQQDVVIITPNEIVVPFDGETITAVPFQIQGTCDQSEEPNLRVVITHADLGFIEERIVVCLADAWAAPDMGAILFNDDFIVTLNADNFVELPFDTHDFTVNEPGNPTPGPPQSGVQCSGVSNLFLEGLCDILSFLFVPNSQTLQGIENLFDELKVKPPLGFLTVALAAFNDLEQGVSSEELDGTADLSSYFDAIKTTFSAILWLLFAVFLVRRVSTIRI